MLTTWAQLISPNLEFHLKGRKLYKQIYHYIVVILCWATLMASKRDKFFFDTCVRNRFTEWEYLFIIPTDVNVRCQTTRTAIFYIHQDTNGIEMKRVIGARSNEKYRNMPTFGNGEDFLYTELLNPELIKQSGRVSEALQLRVGDWRIPMQEKGKSIDSILVNIYEELSDSRKIEPRIFTPGDYKTEYDMMLSRIFGGTTEEDAYSRNRHDAFIGLPGSDNSIFAIIGCTTLYSDRAFNHHTFDHMEDQWLIYAEMLQKAKLAEKLQKEKDRLRQLTQEKMISGIAHEIRNPMTVLGGYGKRLCTIVEKIDSPQAQQAEKAKTYCRIMQDQVMKVERLMSAIDSYRDFKGINPENFEMQDLIKNLASRLNQKTRHDVSIETKNGLSSLYADKKVIGEAIENMVYHMAEEFNGNMTGIQITCSQEENLRIDGITMPKYARITASIRTNVRQIRPIDDCTGTYLQIAKEYANAHDGFIQSDDKNQEISLILPIKQKALPCL
jgi:hypothetical protein